MKNFIRVLMCSIISIGLIATPVAASDLIEFTTVYNTDFAFFGYGGMRGVGSGDITVSGISGSITEAYLYWHGPTDSTDPNANATVNFNGTDVTGTNIGFSSDNCWGFSNSQAYRADVTSLVTGDGTYTLNNFIKTDVEINGVSLVVFYDDGVPGNNSDVVIFNGNDSNITNTYDADNWNANLPGINYSSGTALMRLIVSDGQTYSDESLILNGIEILPPGNNFQGDTTPPSPPVSNGNLWDHFSTDITSYLSPGNNDLTLSTPGVASDCLGLIVVLFDLPAGAAPEQPVPTAVPTMNEWGMIIFMVFAGLGSLYYMRRQRYSKE